MADKTEAQLLKEKLFLNRKNGRLVSDDAVLAEADAFCEGYKKYLDDSKTEREAVKASIKLAEAAGFSEYVAGKKYVAGDRKCDVQVNTVSGNIHLYAE